jgi:hypothetical protein
MMPFNFGTVSRTRAISRLSLSASSLLYPALFLTLTLLVGFLVTLNQTQALFARCYWGFCTLARGKELKNKMTYPEA